jgi:hypothetical protein
MTHQKAMPLRGVRVGHKPRLSIMLKVQLKFIVSESSMTLSLIGIETEGDLFSFTY